MKRVLVVDDERKMRRVLQMLLEHMGIGGTLFLDEIGDMPYALQAKLLRVLQEGIVEPVGSNRRVPVDVRVLSSTNRELAAGIQAGTFREDLYYRLNVFHIEVPPLRERREDVRPIFESYLAASRASSARATSA